MAFLVLGVEITNRNEFRGMGIRFARELKGTLRDTAQAWHDGPLDSHFTPGNEGRYQLEKRQPFYLGQIKQKYGQGQGKWVLLKLSSKSERWMRVFYTITGTSRQATLRMKPPTYFTNPFVGSFMDRRTHRMKHVTRQPDKPAEVTQVNDRDRELLRTFMQRRLQNRINGIVWAGAGI